LETSPRCSQQAVAGNFDVRRVRNPTRHMELIGQDTLLIDDDDDDERRLGARCDDIRQG
jgi:hypothetical protein